MNKETTTRPLTSLMPFCTGVAHQKYLAAEDGIQAAHEAGCTHWYVDGSLFGEMIHEWPEARVAHLNTLSVQTGVKPIFHGNFKAPLASDVEDMRLAAVEYVKREIAIAQKLSAPVIIHGGCIVEPKKVKRAKEIALANYLRSVKELAGYADDRGVDLYLENLSNYKNYRPFHYIFTNLDEYDYILGQVTHRNVYVFLDAGHANICGGDPGAVVSKYHARIKGISFSNNNGQQDQHLGVYEGTLDCGSLVTTILECGWSGLLAFETRDKTTEQAVQELAEVYRAASNRRNDVSSRATKSSTWTPHRIVPAR